MPSAVIPPTGDQSSKSQPINLFRRLGQAALATAGLGVGVFLYLGPLAQAGRAIKSAALILPTLAGLGVGAVAGKRFGFAKRDEFAETVGASGSRKLEHDELEFRPTLDMIKPAQFSQKESVVEGGVQEHLKKDQEKEIDVVLPELGSTKAGTAFWEHDVVRDYKLFLIEKPSVSDEVTSWDERYVTIDRPSTLNAGTAAEALIRELKKQLYTEEEILLITRIGHQGAVVPALIQAMGAIPEGLHYSGNGLAGFAPHMVGRPDQGEGKEFVDHLYKIKRVDGHLVIVAESALRFVKNLDFVKTEASMFQYQLALTIYDLKSGEIKTRLSDISENPLQYDLS